MAYIYRYIDCADNQIKYVGIVWGRTRSLQQRIREHSYFDAWCKTSKWIIEYYASNIITRTDAEFYESHLISLYGTDKYFNKSKSGWGISHFLPVIPDEEWKEYTGSDPNISFSDVGKIENYKRETINLHRRNNINKNIPIKYSLHINKGIWHVSFYLKDVNGKRKQKQLSTGFKAYDRDREINKIEADEKAKEIVERFAVESNCNPDEWTLNVYAKQWLQNHKDCISASTYSRYSSIIYRHISPYFSTFDLSIKMITTDNIRQYCQYKAEHGLCAATISKHIALIHQIFEDAYNKEYVRLNPCINKIILEQGD